DLAGRGDRFLTQFMEHVKTAGTPTDFLSFHAKGQPVFVKDDGKNGHVRMGISNHLKAAENEFIQIEAQSDFKNKPIVIG
ncbi:hypothetical protein, partial [Escherichia coli]|uniref:hypothetical protein n=1 Tax=Escherichia coli TaxID=562 RepID=UPI0028E07F96